MRSALPRAEETAREQAVEFIGKEFAEASRRAQAKQPRRQLFEFGRRKRLCMRRIAKPLHSVEGVTVAGSGGCRPLRFGRSAAES